ncbi:hypothetical protein Csa_023872, partial [Cucumis sativus]
VLQPSGFEESVRYNAEQECVYLDFDDLWLCSESVAS